MQSLGIEVLFHAITIQRLMIGLLVTIKVAAIAIVVSWLLGTFLGVIRTSKSLTVQIIFRIYLELFRIIPILVWLFLLYFILSADFNINLDAQLVSIIVFSLWGAAEMSDIVRGALISLPRHQVESALSIGLNTRQLYWYILIPQAFRRTVPAAINLATRLIKTTSLLVMLGVVEVIKVGQQIIEADSLTNPQASFWVYGFIFFLYFIICYPISKLSQKVLKTS